MVWDIKFLVPEKTKNKNKNMKRYENLKRIIKKALANFTLAKFCGAIITITILAAVKYLISGNFHLEFCDFWNNIGIGLLGWTINTGLIGWLTEYLGIKGINFNFMQILFGFDTMKVGDTNISKPSTLEEVKPKLYNAMDNGEGSSSDKKSGSSKGSSRDRTRDIRFHPYPRNCRRAVRSWTFDDESDNKSENGSENGSNNGSGSDTEMEDGPSNRNARKKLVPATLLDKTSDNTNTGLPLNPFDKGKGIETGDSMQSTLDKGKGIEYNPIQEPSFAIWRQLNPNLDPITTFFPPKTNPGPGFAIPGGDVPINDGIRQHLRSVHVVGQFRNMDLETAMEQRYNYWLCLQNMISKIAYAEQILNKVPVIPTNEMEFKLRNQIIRDLEGLHIVKNRSDASITLLSARIKFIEDEINLQKNNNNNN